jgi:hypothetical protein
MWGARAGSGIVMRPVGAFEDGAVDSDLAEAVAALKGIFERRRISAQFGASDDALLQRLRERLALPRRYLAFLREADPVSVETRTPCERVELVPASALDAEQVGYGRADGGTAAREGWKPTAIVIAHSTLLGDPYFLDTARPDAEGDCPVMTAMSGTDHKPVLCASSFACFLKILAAAMEVAADFADEIADPDDEQIFREALAPRIKVIDPAALRAGHWTS